MNPTPPQATPPRTVRDIVRTVVAQVSPEDLVDLDDLLDLRAAAPHAVDAAARRAARGGSEPTASAAGYVVMGMTSLAIAVVQNVCSELAKDATLKGWQRLKARVRRAPSVLPDDPAPELPANQVDRVREVARATALDLRASPEQADTVADAAIDAWTPPL